MEEFGDVRSNVFQLTMECPRYCALKNKIPPLKAVFHLWTVQDSNLPPPHCKCGALPDELTAQSATIVTEEIIHEYYFFSTFFTMLNYFFCVSASERMWSMKSLNSTFPAFNAFGRSELSVNPGRVFISSR